MFEKIIKKFTTTLRVNSGLAKTLEHGVKQIFKLGKNMFAYKN